MPQSVAEDCRPLSLCESDRKSPREPHRFRSIIWHGLRNGFSPGVIITDADCRLNFGKRAFALSGRFSAADGPFFWGVSSSDDMDFLSFFSPLDRSLIACVSRAEHCHCFNLEQGSQPDHVAQRGSIEWFSDFVFRDPLHELFDSAAIGQDSIAFKYGPMDQAIWTASSCICQDEHIADIRSPFTKHLKKGRVQFSNDLQTASDVTNFRMTSE